MAPNTRTSSALQELRFDAGSLALDLVATVGRRGLDAPHRVERLTDVRTLERWCAGVGIAVAGDVQPASLLAALREARETLWEVLEAHLRHEHARPEPLRRVNDWARAALPAPRLVNGVDGPVALPPTLGLDGVLSLIARDILDILADPERRGLLRQCDSSDCRMVYLVTPGARERRWCSMSQCGNRAKAAAHRARHSPRGEARGVLP